MPFWNHSLFLQQRNKFQSDQSIFYTAVYRIVYDAGNALWHHAEAHGA